MLMFFFTLSTFFVVVLINYPLVYIELYDEINQTSGKLR